MTTTAARNRIQTGVPAGGQYAVEPRSEADVALTTAPAGPGLWVRIEREHQEKDLWVGPYPDEESATRAMEDSLLIDGFCEEDALDCSIADGQPTETDEQVIIDPTDPHHTGLPEVEDQEMPDALDLDDVPHEHGPWDTCPVCE